MTTFQFEELDLSDMHVSNHYFINKTLRNGINLSLEHKEMTQQEAQKMLDECINKLKTQECKYCQEKGHNYQYHESESIKFFKWQMENPDLLQQCEGDSEDEDMETEAEDAPNPE